MATLRKLVERFLAEPPDVTFIEVQTLLNAFGYRERPTKSSHHVFVQAGRSIITVPTVGGRRVKRTYVRTINDLLELEEWYEKDE
ncbi:MAG: type II toxin-antitoxin system HicA family toxin [Dehalococcoidia bacterium]|nr:type II toxin-antitoxin system HicA family toxin [Dehalococcoidia bacterium]